VAQSKNGTPKSIVLSEPIEDIKDKKIDIFEGVEPASSLFDKRGRAVYGDDATRSKVNPLLRSIIKEIKEKEEPNFERIKELLKSLQRPVIELDIEARIAGIDFQRGGNRFLREACTRIPEALAFITEAQKRIETGKSSFGETEDYSSRIQRLNQALGIEVSISDTQLQWEHSNLRKAISKIPEISNILKGICLPVILVQRYSNNIGEELNRLLNGARKSYSKAYSEKKFNYCINPDDLAGKLEIVEGSVYQKVWDKRADGDTIALFFPYALFGYSADHQRRVMKILSKFGFVLSGDIEPLIIYPDLLAAPLKRNANVSLCLSAFSLGSGKNTLELGIGHQAVNLVEGKYPGTPFYNKTGSLLFIE
jgi:hypothetical protein